MLSNSLIDPNALFRPRQYNKKFATYGENYDYVNEQKNSSDLLFHPQTTSSKNDLNAKFIKLSIVGGGVVVFYYMLPNSWPSHLWFF